jgi:hypothetical protein
MTKCLSLASAQALLEATAPTVRVGFGMMCWQKGSMSVCIASNG